MYLKIERPTVFISRTPSPPRLPLPRRINFRVRQRRRIPYICQCRVNFRTRRLRRCTQPFQPWPHHQRRRIRRYHKNSHSTSAPLPLSLTLLRPSDFSIPSAPPISTISTFPHVPSSSYVFSIPLVPQFLRSLRFPRFPRCHYPLFFLRRKKFPEIKCAAT